MSFISKGMKKRVSLCYTADWIIKPRVKDDDMTVGRGSNKKTSTTTSSFGVSKRESHDASKYYDSKL